MEMEVVAYHIERARAGDFEEAFHGLRELGHEKLPELRRAYFREEDATVRALIVEAVWQHRQVSEIDFLAEALQDSSPLVWKQALDGLVTLASAESLKLLYLAMCQQLDANRRAWIEEAIEQLNIADVRPVSSP